MVPQALHNMRQCPCRHPVRESRRALCRWLTLRAVSVGPFRALWRRAQSHATQQRRIYNARTQQRAVHFIESDRPMAKSLPYAKTKLTAFLVKRILELRPRKNQVEIATEAGLAVEIGEGLNGADVLFFLPLKNPSLPVCQDLTCFTRHKTDIPRRNSFEIAVR